jgi:outer membrane murein-binding lipoprotein Lpp
MKALWNKIKNNKLLIAFIISACTTVGCAFVTPEQATKIDSINRDIAALQGSYEGLESRARAVWEAMQKGDIPAVEATALLTKIAAEKEVIVASVQSMQSKVNSLREEGVPWWKILLGAGTNLVLGYFGLKYKGAATRWQGIGETVIEGVESATSSGDAVRTKIRNLAIDYGVQDTLDEEVQKLSEEFAMHPRTATIEDGKVVIKG